jgi:hypothetical protein
MREEATSLNICSTAVKGKDEIVKWTIQGSV